MFCPDCGTWNRAAAAKCLRCGAALPEVSAPPIDVPDEELRELRNATGNRYAIVKRLGSGGMAHVYLARHAVLARSLVIKVLHKTLAKEQEMRERFRREAEAAARLVHPYICGITDMGYSGDIEYLVMPYYAGGSLADLLSRRKTVSPMTAASVASQVSVALDYAHRHGVVHRDIKPDNILFDEDGNVALTDFGIATARFHGRLTASGRAMGTPHYMSPEQAMGRLVDGRSDLYAVGLLLYEMLLGNPPFDGDDSYSVGYKHVHEAPVAPDTVDTRIPAALSAIVMRCLAKQPAERYDRGFELADALVQFLQGSGGAELRNARTARASGLTPL
ncbi:MAG: serine/threonine protein kinase [Gemmatimonadaceae bacterium]|jgi:serine/threonine-protein kinase|nr:serine/threonine protein kinase [Gemmatimonadaceae bacterium]